MRVVYLDCTLTIIEPTVDYDFHEICEFRNFSVSKSSVCTLGDKRIIKEITSLQRKFILGLLSGRDTFACLPSATANLSFLLRRERPLFAGKPLHPSLARRHSTNRSSPIRKSRIAIKPTVP